MGVIIMSLLLYGCGRSRLFDCCGGGSGDPLDIGPMGRGGGPAEPEEPAKRIGDVSTEGILCPRVGFLLNWSIRKKSSFAPSPIGGGI